MDIEDFIQKLRSLHMATKDSLGKSWGVHMRIGRLIHKVLENFLVKALVRKMGDISFFSIVPSFLISFSFDVTIKILSFLSSPL